MPLHFPLCLCSRYHVRVTYEWLLSYKILCPRRQGSGPAVHSYWSCRDSLSRGDDVDAQIQLEKAAEYHATKRECSVGKSQEEKGLPVDYVGSIYT